MASESKSGDGAMESKSGDGAMESKSGDGAMESKSGDGAMKSKSGDGAMESKSGDGATESKSVAFTLQGTMLEALLTSKVGEGRATTEVAPETLGMMQLLQETAITRESLDGLGASPTQVRAALAAQMAAIPALAVAATALLPPDDSAVEPWKGCVDDTPAAAIGLALLLREKLLTADALDRLLVSHEQVLVAVMNQLARLPDVGGYAVALAGGLVSPEALAAVECWEDITASRSHEALPHGWQQYTFAHLDDNDQTALEAALERGDDPTALAYLRSPYGAFGCEYVSHDGTTALMVAVREDRREVCEAMLALVGAEGCSADSADDDGWTALMYLCCQPWPDIAMQLVELGCDGCNAGQMTCDAETALMHACSNAATVAMALLDMGPDACRAAQVSCEGFTALMRACEADEEAVALRLVELGPKGCCSSSAAFQELTTALTFACGNCLETVAHKLLDMGAEECCADQVCDDGETALTLACRARLETVAVRLVQFGVHEDDPEAALLKAIQHLLPAVALAIVSFGAGPGQLAWQHGLGWARELAVARGELMAPVVDAIDAMDVAEVET